MVDVSDDAEVAYVFHIITGSIETGATCLLTPDFNMVIIFQFYKIFINIRPFSGMSTGIRKRSADNEKRAL
jgi:hypothetical protein